jgi:PAS domain S-box-containing protein
MSSRDNKADRLIAENAELRARLREAEDTLAAIRSGDVDALVVGNDIYTLDSANAVTNKLRKDVLTQMEDAVIAFDRDDHVVFMNPAAERQYDRTSSEALGRPKPEVFEERWPDAAAEVRARAELQEAGVHRQQSVHVRHDGRELHVESTLSRLRDADGSAIGHLAVIRDVSERVRAEGTLGAATRTLAQRERQFATLVENSPDILTRLDRGLRHVYVSPVIGRYTGLDPSYFIGKTHAEAGMPPELCERWQIVLSQVLATGREARIRFGYTAVDNERRTFDARLVPEFAEDGTVESVLSIAADVTEQELVDAQLRESQVRLQEADRRKDEFLATLAHELRNPLAPIRNALQIMRLTDDLAMNSNARGIIERQLQQMVHLVDDLLDVSRITQGKVELRRENVDVVTAVQTAIETSRPLIDGGRHELTVRLPALRTLIVDADITRLCQIVANLLNNAAKYTPEGGQIEVAAGSEGDRALISVKDSGVGIPPEMLPRVFEMFAQVDRSLDRSQGGLGIGLALVKRLVEMHGGSVEAHSEGQGSGCQFVVRLPLVQGAAAAPQSAPAATPEAEPGNEIRVLVVDDNVDHAESLSQVLRILGYATRTAHDGISALRLAESYRPHAAVLDIGLPDKSGVEVARAIRTQSWGRDMLLIALSGWGQEEDRRRTREAGFDHHFVKPLDMDALTDLLAPLKRAAATDDARPEQAVST